MKRNYAFIAALSAVLLLAGCNGQGSTSQKTSSSESNSKENSIASTVTTSENKSSSQSNSSFDISNAESVPFSQIDEVINGAFRAEVYNTSSVEIKDSRRTNNRVYESNETFKMLKDYTSYSEGKVTLFENDVKKDEDSFKRRTQVLKEKIELNNITNDYRLFAQVTDYENDKFNSYNDTASKVYIIKNAEEAAASNLTEGSYILESDLLALSSSYQLPKLYEFIGVQLISSVYVSQTGIQSFKRSKDSAGVTYSCLVEYSLDGDLNDVSTTTISVEFKLNSDEDQLLEATYFVKVDDVSKDDPTDRYISETKTEVKMNYGSRESKAEALLNCEDYFVQTISEIEILKIDNYGNRVPCDPKNFPLTSSYLFVKAKTYTPSKALELSVLHPTNSSNAEVISIDANGYMKVLKEGTTTLTFSFYGLDKDGIYREKEIKQVIEVTNSIVDHVSILNSGPDEDTLEIGKSYVVSAFVSPSTVDQSITVSVDNPDVLKAEVNNDNNVVITGLKGGEATITVTSTKDPTKSVTHKYFVADDLDYKEIITSHTYFYETTIYKYSFTMNFNADGTGTRVQVDLSNGKSITDTFTYRVSGIQVIFDSWSVPEESDAGLLWNFDVATIAQNGNIVSCYNEDTYSTYRFTMKDA